MLYWKILLSFLELTCAIAHMSRFLSVHRLDYTKSNLKKNAYALKTPHVAVFITVILVSQFFGNSICEVIDDLQETFHWNTKWNVFWPGDLDLWIMTLTYKFDLHIIPLDLHSEIQVCMSVRSVVRVVTHRQTDTHRRCQNYYTRHITDVGCKNYKLVNGTREDICICAMVHVAHINVRLHFYWTKDSSNKEYMRVTLSSGKLCINFPQMPNISFAFGPFWWYL